LAGTVGEESDRRRLILTRFESDGRLDQSFGRQGRLGAPLTSVDHPTKILPTRDGVLVILSGGPRPLLTFARNGKVRRRPIGAHPWFFGDVRATVSRGRLILGWTTYSRAEKAKIYHLASRSLERP
jgi:hypothetical protein